MGTDRDCHVTSQAIGGMNAGDMAQRTAAEVASLARQDAALAAALKAMADVREFIGTPEHILGSPATKHGEIAEHVEVGVRNAWDYLRQHAPSATFDGVARTAPEDYLVNGVAVQSKFINGVGQSLDHVLDHMRKYPGFGRDGSFYHIPKDQHALIEKLLTGEATDGLSARKAQDILGKVEAIKSLAGGQSLEQILRPSTSTYAEVQQGAVHQTLDGHEQRLRNAHDQRLEQIKQEHQPGISDALGAVGKGALVGTGVRLTVALYQKAKEGKNPLKGDFSPEDWKAVGLDAGQGALQGGIAAGTIYGLTQYANLTAPFAAAVASSAMAVGTLAKQYLAGEIGFSEFVELGLITCAEGAMVGIASAAGQTLIPIPVIGALVGATAGRLLLSFSKDHLGGATAQLANHLKTEYQIAIGKLNEAQQAFVQTMMETYDRLGDLTRLAFDVSRNVELRLLASVDLALAYGVAGPEILRDTQELDSFMLA